MTNPAVAAVPPAPAPKSRWLARRVEAVWAPVREWLKLEDSRQVGLWGRREARRLRYPQMRVLFVDVGNSARSPVAEAHAQLLGFHAESAGTFPSMRLQPEAVHVLQENGIDISGWRPKPLDIHRLQAFDRVIVMSNALPSPWSKQENVEHWNVHDPQGLGLDAYRVMRKDIERRLKVMARRHRVRPAPAVEQAMRAEGPAES